MGKMGLLLVAGLAIAIGIYSMMMNRNSNIATMTSASYYSRLTAKNANNAALQLGLQKLSDLNSWRSGYTNLSVSGGVVSLALKDTVIAGGDSAIQLTASCPYYADSMVNSKNSLTTTVLVQIGIRPRAIKGAWTANGPLNNTISDMWIDGRDHDTGVVSNGPPTTYTLLPNNGVYGVATSNSTFINTESASIGGTSPAYVDYAPTFPENPNSVKTGAFPEGYPKSPDAVFGWPEGTLKSIAKSGANGSRYLTTQAQMDNLCKLKLPLQGVTFVEPADNDTLWGKKNIPDKSGGIFVFHNDRHTAYWKDISGVNTKIPETFRGIMIFDKMFHFHMNCLGALVILTSNTVTTENCNGNQDKTVAYSGKLVQNLTKMVAGSISGGWRQKLTVISWVE